MAGLGRRSHYRKHLTDSVLHEFPEPDASKGDRIAKVVATRGGNLFDVLVAYSNKDDSLKNRQSQIAILPTKFHKLVWVKRNDFVICRTGTDEPSADNKKTSPGNNNEAGGGVRLEITHILYKDQVNHLKKQNLWPSYDDEFSTSQDTDTDRADMDRVRDLLKTQNESGDTDSDSEEEDDKEAQDDRSDNDGIVYNVIEDDDYFLNTNRIKNMTLQDDSSSDESSEDEG